MAFEFKLPDIGEGVAEGEVVKWLVKEGDSVKEDQPIVEIMTDKATVEIASPKSGKVQKLYANEGQVVKVGKTLVAIDENGSGSGKAAPTQSAPKETKPEALFTASAVPPRRPGMSGATSERRVLASPATRRQAREQGIDLSTISGTGPGGRVTRDDLSSTGASPQPARKTTVPVAPFAPRKTVPTGGENRIPLRGIRKRIAEHMVKSRTTAMHFSQIDEVDMTTLVEFRTKAKEWAAARGIKLTYLAFFVKAVCKGLQKYPGLNSSLDDEKQEIVEKGYYNIGIAVQTDAGLVVPVIKNADQKTVLELAQEISSLADKARQGKLSPDELHGGTFTITSTGGSGGLFATPIINHPEVGILGVNRIQETPVVRNGQIVIRHMGHVSLSLDHRVVDGATGAEFLQTVIAHLENPLLFVMDE